MTTWSRTVGKGEQRSRGDEMICWVEKPPKNTQPCDELIGKSQREWTASSGQVSRSIHQAGHGFILFLFLFVVDGWKTLLGNEFFPTTDWSSPPPPPPTEDETATCICVCLLCVHSRAGHARRARTDADAHWPGRMDAQPTGPRSHLKTTNKRRLGERAKRKWLCSNKVKWWTRKKKRIGEKSIYLSLLFFPYHPAMEARAKGTEKSLRSRAYTSSSWFVCQRELPPACLSRWGGNDSTSLDLLSHLSTDDSNTTNNPSLFGLPFWFGFCFIWGVSTYEYSPAAHHIPAARWWWLGSPS